MDGQRSLKRILALDVGQKRIGVALSDPTGLIATPLEVVQRSPQGAHWQRLLELAQSAGAEAFLVGMPLLPDGRPGAQARDVEAFAAGLRRRTALPILAHDERFSTQGAQEALRRAGVGRKRRRQREDAVAAAVILQEYLDSQRAATTPRVL
ncbi:MAG: Holliday junction resolvase RuvX [Dehalococcoidia bacterium]|nr:Holliday junction resolvase RuvX [Dehalococcoidia bacterium]